MRRRKTLLLLAYTALLTTSLVALSQGRESRIMQKVHREAGEMKALLMRSGHAAQTHVRLIEAHYRQAQEPDTPKAI